MRDAARRLTSEHPLEPVGYLRTTAPPHLGGAPDEPVTTVDDHRRAQVFLGICVGTVAIALDLTIVNVALPSIRADLGGRIQTVQWVVSIYSLAFAVFVVPAGRLVDMVGARRMFLLGSAIYAAASLVAGLAPNEAVLIAARVPQGVGAALIGPAAAALIALLYDVTRRGAVFGLMGGIVGAAAGLAPLVGGLLTDAVGWRAVFLLGIPLVALASALVARVPRAVDGEAPDDLDMGWTSTILLGIGVVSLLMAFVEIGGLGRARAGALAAVGVLALVGLWRNERGRAIPLVDLALLRDRVVAGGIVAKMMVSFAYYGALLYLVLYLQGTLGLGAATTGLILLPSALAEVVLSPVIGPRVTDRRTRPFVAVGLGLTSMALFLLAVLDSTSSVFWHLLPGLLVIGIGYTMVNVSVRVGAHDAVDDEEQGRLSSLMTMSGKLAGSFGVAFAALVFHARSVAHAREALAAGRARGLTLAEILRALAAEDLPDRVRQMMPLEPGETESGFLALIDDTFLSSLGDLLVTLACLVLLGGVVAWALLRPRPAGGRRTARRPGRR